MGVITFKMHQTLFGASYCHQWWRGYHLPAPNQGPVLLAKAGCMPEDPSKRLARYSRVMLFKWAAYTKIFR